MALRTVSCEILGFPERGAVGVPSNECAPRVASMSLRGGQVPKPKAKTRPSLVLSAGSLLHSISSWVLWQSWTCLSSIL